MPQSPPSQGSLVALTSRAGLALGLLALIVVSAPSAAACVGSENKVLRGYFESTSETGTRGQLQLDQPSGTAVEAMKVSDPAGPAVTRFGDGMSGKRVLPVVEFEMPGVLERDYWLNVSKGVSLVFNVSSQSMQLSPPVQDSIRIRASLHAGDRLVAGYEGIVRGLYGAWANTGQCVRPELAVLEKGTKLKVRVEVYTALTDVWIGTRAPRTSTIQVAYFETDPLANGAARSAGKLEFGAASPPADQSAAPTILLALALAPALALRRPRRAAALALVLLLLIAGLAGCTRRGGRPLAPSSGATSSAPEIEVSYEPQGPGEAGQYGNVSFLVVDADRANVAISGAHVLILGTSQFGSTNKSGRIAFSGLLPGVYEARADAPGFEPRHESIEVRAGTNARVTIPMSRAAGPSNKLPHEHPDWEPGRTEAEFDSFEQMLAGYVSGNKVPSSAGRWTCVNAHPAPVPTTNLLPSPSRCETRLMHKPDARVLPGANRLEITLKWSNVAPRPAELALSVKTPFLPANHPGFTFMPRGPDVPFNIVFFPHEADPGHQKFTLWRFYAVILESQLGSPGAYVDTSAQVSLQVKIRQFKGVVPVEPPHTDLWAGSSMIELVKPFSFKAITTADYPGVGPFVEPGLTNQWGKGAMVPVGALEVRGFLNWTPTQGLPWPALTNWQLRYQPAHLGANLVHPSQYPLAASTPNANGKGIAWRIPLNGPEAANYFDLWYQARSYWAFYLEDNAEGTPLTGHGRNDATVFRQDFTFTAWVHRDPAFKDDGAE